MAELTVEEWTRRYKERLVEVLADPERGGVTRPDAEAMAAEEFDAVGFEEVYDGYEDDPEASADETISYWGEE